MVDLPASESGVRKRFIKLSYDHGLITPEIKVMGFPIRTSSPCCIRLSRQSAGLSQRSSPASVAKLQWIGSVRPFQVTGPVSATD